MKERLYKFSEHGLFPLLCIICAALAARQADLAEVMWVLNALLWWGLYRKAIGRVDRLHTMNDELMDALKNAAAAMALTNALLDRTKNGEQNA